MIHALELRVLLVQCGQKILCDETQHLGCLVYDTSEGEQG